MFTPATIVEYLGHPVNFAERIDLGGATSVGMIWRAAAAIELGICDVVVCAAPARPIPEQSERAPDRSAPLLRREQRRVGFAAGRVRRSVRQRRAELRLRDDRATLRGRVRLRPARHGETGCASTRECGAANPNAAFFGQPVSDRRRAREQTDCGSAADARDRDAGCRRQRGGGCESRSCASVAGIAGLGHRIRRTPDDQDADVRAATWCIRRSVRHRNRHSRWPASKPADVDAARDLRLLHDHRAADARRRRLLRQRRRHGFHSTITTSPSPATSR